MANSQLKVGGSWIEHVKSRDIHNHATTKSMSTYNDENVETSLRGITRWSFKVACKDDWTITEKYYCGGDDRVIVKVGSTVVPG